MLFGQSVFQSVLDRLDAEDEEAVAPAAQAAHRIHGLNTGFASDVLEGVSAPSARPDQAYVDNMETDRQPEQPFAGAADKKTEKEKPEKTGPPVSEKPGEKTPPVVLPAESPPAPPVMPPHLARVAPADVAAELGITAKDTLQSLNDKRRAFARANHPDGIAAAFRDNANTRMKIANLLIDEAIRRIAIAARLSR